MAQIYVLTVGFESYEYDGEFYIVGDGYGTASDVLRHVAADHIMAIEQSYCIEEYLLDVLKEGENVSESEYEQVDADIECGIHVDVDYQRFAFWVGDRVLEIDGQPTQSKIESVADSLRS